MAFGCRAGCKTTLRRAVSMATYHGSVPIYDIFSKRKQRADVGNDAAYRYDSFPVPLRRQIVLILGTSLGKYEQVGSWDYEIPIANKWWEFIRAAVARE